jgi:capsule polysaccharide export protein KpsE/RkpR
LTHAHTIRKNRKGLDPNEINKPFRIREMKLLDTLGILNTAISNAAVSKYRRRLPRLGILLLVTVLIPTLVAGIYLRLIASNLYTSKSHFIDRNPQCQASPDNGVLLQGAGFTRSQDDTYSVFDYLQSRDALHALDRKFKFFDRFGKNKNDFLSHLDPFGINKIFESLYGVLRPPRNL